MGSSKKSLSRALLLMRRGKRRQGSPGEKNDSKESALTNAKLAQPVDLHRHPSAWIYMVSLWLVPIISLCSHVSPEQSPPLILSTAWICLELGAGLSALLKGEAYSAHLSRGMLRLYWALALWVFADLHDLSALLPWIIMKILIGSVILMSRRWSQDHHLLVTHHPEKVALGIEALTITAGVLCGSSMIYFWKTAPHFTISESLLFILSQSAYLALALARLSYDRLLRLSGESLKSARYYVALGSLQIGAALFAVLALDDLSGPLNHEGVMRGGVIETITEKLAPFLISGFLVLFSLLSARRIINFSNVERALLTPWRALSLSMVTLCVLGSALLMTPIVQYGSRTLTFTEAAFTSVSASCITGLSVIDLSQLNGAGQAVILLLIQIGGFGIILMTHMIISMSARHYSFYVHNLTHAVVGDEFSPLRDAKQLFRFVLSVELFSAFALTVFFLLEGHDLSQAVWRGLFTAISAFCNAGFALQSDSFISYATNTPVLIIISLTVILGGLGPRAIKEVIKRWRDRADSRPLSLYTRVILWSNGVLLLIPTLFFFVSDSGGALAHLDWSDQLTNAFFHTTSLRTAGFNSFDLAQLSGPSWSLSLLLMIIGGSPFSTAGGIKVTTVALAVTAFIPTLRGDKYSLLGERAQPIERGAKALAIFLLSFVIIGGVLFTLQCLGEPLDLKVMLFEVISALGTVGLSQGGTNALSGAGLGVIMFCMFLGRIGPPALLLSLTRSQSEVTAKDPTSYVEEALPLS